MTAAPSEAPRRSVSRNAAPIGSQELPTGNSHRYSARFGLVAVVLFGLAAVFGSDFGAEASPSDTDRFETARSQCLASDGLDAVHSCDTALALRDDANAILRHLAWIMLSHNRPESSINLYKRLAQLNSKAADAYFDLAAAQATFSRYADAEKTIRIALRLQPDHLPSHRLGGIIYETLGLHELAFSTHVVLAGAGLRTGMYDLALDYHYGRGTAPDARRALHWYEAAAAKGHVAAMDMLAKGHASGLFGKVDSEAAEIWRRRANEERGYWPPLLGQGRQS